MPNRAQITQITAIYMQISANMPLMKEPLLKEN